MACVFVAGKVEECIRRARDIVNVFHHLYCVIRKLPAHPIDYVGDTYYVWRDRLCTTEAILLRELGFHVQPASPVGLLISYMKILEIADQKDDQFPELPQMALNFLNDALKTQSYILFQPRVLAVSSIALALEKLGLTHRLLPPPESLKHPWFTLFDVNETELAACMKLIMPVYNRELDVLLPLTKEELAIFTDSIRSVADDSQTVPSNEHVKDSSSHSDEYGHHQSNRSSYKRKN
jgi:cyclin L